MKNVSAAIALMLVMVFAATADAHRSRWYWTERKADIRITTSYSDVRNADCIGFGPTRGGVRYSHFFCSLKLDDGTGMTVTVETLGRRKARVLYNHQTDIIR
jgi:hypothetical protein